MEITSFKPSPSFTQGGKFPVNVHYLIELTIYEQAKQLYYAGIVGVLVVIDDVLTESCPLLVIFRNGYSPLFRLT